MQSVTVLLSTHLSLSVERSATEFSYVVITDVQTWSWSSGTMLLMTVKPYWPLNQQILKVFLLLFISRYS